MGGRWARWVGAGTLVLGLGTGLLAGAAVAAAEPESGTGATAGSVSKDANSFGAQSDSKTTTGAASTGAAASDGGTVDTKTTSTTTKVASTVTKPEPSAAPAAPTGKIDGTAGATAAEVSATGTAEAATATEIASETAPATPSATATPTPSATATPTAEATAAHTSTEATALKAKPTTDATPAAKAVAVTPSPPDPTPATTDDKTAAPTVSAKSVPQMAEPSPQPSPAVVPVATSKTAESTPAPAATAKLFAAAQPAPAATPTGPSLINVLGTIAFAVFDFVTKLFEGPPAVPPGSTVAVGRSTLNIDCGDDTPVEADWYFPTGPEPVTGLIYFQHGFGATAGFYNYTAATLAQETNSIVVAPTISSNLFDCFGCSLVGAAMQQGVADLFVGDRAELTRSARVASGDPNLVLPDRVVVSGHSTGGGTALGIAGDLAANPDTAPDLAGVMLFDSSPLFGGISTAAVLAKIPDDVPVLNIAGEPSFWDSYGELSAALEAARPGQFNGVEVVGGSHSDAFQTSNPLIQFVVYLGTGFSAPQNVAANFDLAGGWIDDMFAGTANDPATRTGIYGDPGTTITIPTSAGIASAYVLPGPPVQLGPLDALIKLGVDWLGGTSFASCAVDPAAMADTSGVAPAKLSTRNTALSLDGRPQTGQSVGQHVCTGDGLPASAG